MTRQEIVNKMNSWSKKYDNYSSTWKRLTSKKRKYVDFNNKLKSTIGNIDKLKTQIKKLIDVIRSGVIIYNNEGFCETELSAKNEKISAAELELQELVEYFDSQISDLNNQISSARRKKDDALDNYRYYDKKLKEYDAAINIKNN